MTDRLLNRASPACGAAMPTKPQAVELLRISRTFDEWPIASVSPGMVFTIDASPRALKQPRTSLTVGTRLHRFVEWRYLRATDQVWRLHGWASIYRSMGVYLQFGAGGMCFSPRFVAPIEAPSSPPIGAARGVHVPCRGST